MSVKELKAHLTRLHTDHSLCVEKSELVALLCAVKLHAVSLAALCAVSLAACGGPAGTTSGEAMWGVEQRHGSWGGGGGAGCLADCGGGARDDGAATGHSWLPPVWTTGTCTAPPWRRASWWSYACCPK